MGGDRGFNLDKGEREKWLVSSCIMFIQSRWWGKAGGDGQVAKDILSLNKASGDPLCQTKHYLIDLISQSID